MFSVAGLTAFVPFLQSAKRKKKNKDMFVHHVYFWLKNPGSTEDNKKLLEGLQTLTPIETIRTSHIGVPAPTNREVIEKGYDYSLLLIFDNLEDQEIYQKHPTHLKFVDGYAHLWSKVIVYDSVDAK